MAAIPAEKALENAVSASGTKSMAERKKKLKDYDFGNSGSEEKISSAGIAVHRLLFP